jgi:hypothetical protein
MHYCYHNRIRQRINNGELIGIEPSEKEEFAFVLVFKTYPFTRPIRWTATQKYSDLFEIKA